MKAGMKAGTDGEESPFSGSLALSLKHKNNNNAGIYYSDSGAAAASPGATTDWPWRPGVGASVANERAVSCRSSRHHSGSGAPSRR